jgi:hypothetical protein
MTCLAVLEQFCEMRISIMVTVNMAPDVFQYKTFLLIVEFQRWCPYDKFTITLKLPVVWQPFFVLCWDLIPSVLKDIEFF